MAKSTQKVKNCDEIPRVQKLHPFKQCGAKGKRSGLPCVQPAMKNGRCRFHGGKSTGATSEEIKTVRRIMKALKPPYKDELRVDRAKVKALLNDCQATLDEVKALTN